MPKFVPFKILFVYRFFSFIHLVQKTPVILSLHSVVINEISLIFCYHISLSLLRNRRIEYILHIYRTFQKINERPHLNIIQISNNKHFNDACHSMQIRWKFRFNAQQQSQAILPHSSRYDEFRFVYIKSERNQQIAKPKATVMLWPFCQWYIFIIWFSIQNSLRNDKSP